MTNDKCDDWIHWESHQVYIKSIKYMFANPNLLEKPYIKIIIV